MTRQSRGDDALRRAKGTYAAGARGAGRLFTRAGWLPTTPPSRDDRARHWLYSLTRAHDSLALIDLDVPWWTYSAIDAVENWMADRTAPIRVFEYGSGASSVWLANRVAEVHTVEHDVGFAELMRERLIACGNVELHVIPPAPAAAPTVPSAKEGYAGMDFSSYVAAIDGRGSFDLVVIDGRARQTCLARALPSLRPDGMIVFDNSARRRYRAAITASRLTETRLRGLTPTLPYPEQTSLLRPRS